MKTYPMKKPKIQFSGERLIPELNFNKAFYFEHLNRYLFASQHTTNKTVLDLACGTGYGSYILANTGSAKKVFGIDKSIKTISYAKYNYSKKNIVFSVKNVLNKTIYDQRYDIIVCFELIEHLNEKQQGTLINLLPKDSVLIISTPNTENYQKGNKFHKNELTLNAFRSLLQKKYNYVQIFCQKYYLSDSITKENQYTLRKKNTKVPVSKPFTELNWTFTNTNHNPEYFIAVCSNNQIGNSNNTSVDSSIVDEFNLSRGYLSLSEQFNSIKREYLGMKQTFERITNRKIYKFSEKVLKILKK